VANTLIYSQPIIVQKVPSPPIAITVAESQSVAVQVLLAGQGPAGAPGNVLLVPYDIGLFVPGKPASGATLIRFVFARAISFQVNLAGSVSLVGAAPAAASVFSISKNGSSIGTLSFAASASYGAFSVANPQSFAIGDILSIMAPLIADASLADLSITLEGTRL